MEESLQRALKILRRMAVRRAAEKRLSGMECSLRPEDYRLDGVKEYFEGEFFVFVTDIGVTGTTLTFKIPESLARALRA